MIPNYLKIALRNLLRQKAFSFINISGLSLGLACCMLILLYTKDEVSFDQFHEKKDRIFRVTATITGEDEVRKVGSTSMVVAPAFREEIPEIETFVRLQQDLFTLRRGQETFRQEALYADGNFFSEFSLPLVSGDPDQVLKELNSVVLTEAAAEKYFGSGQAVGQTLELEIAGQFEPFVVTGIAQNPPLNSSIQFGAVLPFAYTEKRFADPEWVNFVLNSFVILHPDADPGAVAAKLDGVFNRRAQEQLAEMREKYNFKNVVHFGLQPLTKMHLDTEFGDIRNGLSNGSKPIYSYILSGIALFILALACVNFVTMTVSNSLRRGKEIGIRKVVGGQRRQLMGQFLWESYGLTFLAFALAIVLVELALPTFNALANKQLSLHYLLGGDVVLAYLGLFLVTGFLAGFYPALVLSGFDPLQTLQQRQKFTQNGFLTKGLVVFQFAVASFLIMATVGVHTQFTFLTHKDLGYEDADLVTIHLGRRAEESQVLQLKREMEQEPSVRFVSAKSFGQNYTTAKVAGKEIEFAFSLIDEQYLPALQIPVVAGRNFSPAFPADPAQSVIINEAFAREAGWAEPIGQTVDLFWADQRLTVVGVVQDHHFASLKEKISPQLFTNDPSKMGYGDLWVKILPGNPPQTLQMLEQIHKKVRPFQPFEYDFVSAVNERQYEAEAKWRQIISLAALLAIAIASFGFLGLTALSIQQRAKEIGIRKVFGAAISDIVLLLSVDFVKLVVVAIAVATPLAWYSMRRWLQDYTYRIDLEWWMFGGAGLMALLIALATVSYQVTKAALLNPVKSLRSE